MECIHFCLFLPTFCLRSSTSCWPLILRVKCVFIFLFRKLQDLFQVLVVCSFTVALDCTISCVRHTDVWSGSPCLAVQGNLRGYWASNLSSVHFSHFGNCIVWMVVSRRSPLAWCRSSFPFCPHFAFLLGLLISVGLGNILWSFFFFLFVLLLVSKAFLKSSPLKTFFVLPERIS